MANPGQLWVLAGGNGAGKSTFYNLFLAKCGIKFVKLLLLTWATMDFDGGSLQLSVLKKAEAGPESCP